MSRRPLAGTPPANQSPAFLATPGLKVSWKTTKVEAAKSGEIGYSYGTYEMTFNDAKGKPMSDRGKYLEVWKKQSDGTWKCAADMFSSDLPLASTK
jgi:ketosteroid isomerase-like protein